MTAILGISSFYHDSAAALVVDGEIVAAAQEERFTRRKHDARFPTNAIHYCLGEARLQTRQIDYIAYHEKPLVKFDRLIETYLAYAPRGFASFSRALPHWIKGKLNMRRLIRRELIESTSPIVFLDHHESHAASAFFPSPYEEAAILTADGVGEWSTTTLGVGRGNRIELHDELRFPHSLGLLYSAFTYYCGFRVNSGEHKLMGLAPYGEPRFASTIREHLIDLEDDGSFRLDMRFFNYCQGLTMTGPRFHELFGGPPREPESPLDQRHLDLAASIQDVTEEVVLRLGREVHRRTGLDRLVMAGGVAMNCVANGRLSREGPFRSLWVQPAAGDAGGALGAALFVWNQLLERPRIVQVHDSQKGSLLGPAFTEFEIRAALDARGLTYDVIEAESDLVEQVAADLEAGLVVGWFQGRMEFGPRALGNRSILADARRPDTQATLNLKTKFRESFRPFAPAVLAESASLWFDLPQGSESPYMLLVAPVHASRLVPLTVEQTEIMKSDEDLKNRINVPRSSIPAVTHIDNSARVQTVDPLRNPRLFHLLSVFERRTGCPVLVNTSFNVRGEPIVCTPDDAVRCFLATEMDLLVLENCVVRKRSVPRDKAIDAETHLASFERD